MGILKDEILSKKSFTFVIVLEDLTELLSFEVHQLQENGKTPECRRRAVGKMERGLVEFNENLMGKS